MSNREEVEKRGDASIAKSRMGRGGCLGEEPSRLQYKAGSIKDPCINDPITLGTHVIKGRFSPLGDEISDSFGNAQAVGETPCAM